MQAAAPRARKSVVEELAAAKGARGVAAAGAKPAAARYGQRMSAAEREFAEARQDYLEALPIPAFLACLDEQEEAFVGLANDKFSEVAGWDESRRARGSRRCLPQASGIGAAVAASSGEAQAQFESMTAIWSAAAIRVKMGG